MNQSGHKRFGPGRRPEPIVPNAPIQRQKGLDAAAAASVLKKRDIDRYWAALFAPAAKRSGLVALYAFNSELAHITAVVSEPMVGQIRLQWWRDAIELAIPGTKTGNPIADALAAAIFEYEIEKESLLRMVDARLPEILGEPPPDIPALRAALWDRSGIIFGISANILGASDAATRKAAEHAGLAYGLTELLRSIPQQASRRKLLLPPSYFESRGVDLTTIYNGKMSASFAASLADLRGAANRALQQFRAIAPELNAAAWPAFLPLTLVRPYLMAMAGEEFNPLATFPSVNPLRRFWRIWRAARQHRI